MMMIRSNCDEKDDYDLQVETIIDRFCEKVYKPKYLSKTRKAIRDMEREDLFKKKEGSKRDYGVPANTKKM